MHLRYHGSFPLLLPVGQEFQHELSKQMISEAEVTEGSRHLVGREGTRLCSILAMPRGCGQVMRLESLKVNGTTVESDVECRRVIGNALNGEN